jgi:hypothetical protein
MCVGGLPGFVTRLGLFIQSPGHRSRAAAFIKRDNDNYKHIITPGNPQLITKLDSPGRLTPLTIDMHSPTGNSLTGSSPGFKKPGSPKPLIDPYFFFFTG